MVFVYAWSYTLLAVTPAYYYHWLLFILQSCRYLTVHAWCNSDVFFSFRIHASFFVTMMWHQLWEMSIIVFLAITWMFCKIICFIFTCVMQQSSPVNCTLYVILPHNVEIVSWLSHHYTVYVVRLKLKILQKLRFLPIEVARINHFRWHLICAWVSLVKAVRGRHLKIQISE